MSDLHISQIRTTLEAGLSPLALQVLDESHLHAGHAHNRARPDGGITHLRVRVVADAFRGKSRVDRHRIVNALLAGEIAGGLHALAIDAKTPEEVPAGGAA
ncbi:BolA family transcriptional regulator [Azorhizobium oxalatiphilum]|uniref:BolA family transcriptional regulator n=1 Tax=Azorhizobium oxalatiphilum TaxID=980631 RepID=A0A917CEL1_9HYPH|nr:BolA family protein [Azorhizobium oxalatiphilum]GGF85051.1 BolA family transcriptional regulator [Azorhizobium oxalatiphilum]